MKKLMLCMIIGSFLIAGCATQQVKFTDKTPNMKKEVAELDKWNHFFVFGLAPPHQSIEVDKYCNQDGPALIQTEQTFINGLVSAITYNLYTPQSMTMYCK